MITKMFRGPYDELENKMNEFFEKNQGILVRHITMMVVPPGVDDKKGESLSEIMLRYEEIN